MQDRFWEKVDKGDGCWEWNATLSKDGGYGMFYISAKRHTVKAHRVSWELANGAIPKGQLVCHRCDNPKCVRPDHLFLGDYLANNQDMVRKERHGMMKFTHAQVVRLRDLYRKYRGDGKRDFLSHRRIADWFGVSRSTISHLLTARNWSHV